MMLPDELWRNAESTVARVNVNAAVRFIPSGHQRNRQTKAVKRDFRSRISALAASSRTHYSEGISSSRSVGGQVREAAGVGQGTSPKDFEAKSSRARTCAGVQSSICGEQKNTGRLG